MNAEPQRAVSSANQASPSFVRRFGTGIANFLLLLLVGYLGLVVIFGALWLILPPLNEMSPGARDLIDTFYRGYVTAMGLAAILNRPGFSGDWFS
jgi:hypothetical protein